MRLVLRAPVPVATLDFARALAPLVGERDATLLAELRVDLATQVALARYDQTLVTAAIEYRRCLVHTLERDVLVRDRALARTYARLAFEWRVPLPALDGDAAAALHVRDTALRVECVAATLVLVVALANESTTSVAKLVAARRALDDLDERGPLAAPTIRRSPFDARARGAAAPRIASPLFIDAWRALVDALVAERRAVDASSPVAEATRWFEAMRGYARAADGGMRDVGALHALECAASARAYAAVARAIEADASRLEHAFGVAVACATEAARIDADEFGALAARLAEHNDCVYGAQHVPPASSISVELDAAVDALAVDDAYRVRLPRIET